MTRYFISGHLDLTDAEFQNFYVPRLESARATPGARFVVGDAPGADSLAQKWLHERGAPVTVYHMLTAPRFNAGFPTEGGFLSDRDRDEALTAASDADIAWVRPGREKSGTARNLQRRGAR